MRALLAFSRLRVLQAVGQTNLDECLTRHAKTTRFLVDLA
jgi:hypothetical protein